MSEVYELTVNVQEKTFKNASGEEIPYLEFTAQIGDETVKFRPFNDVSRYILNRYFKKEVN